MADPLGDSFISGEADRWQGSAPVKYSETEDPWGTDRAHGCSAAFFAHDKNVKSIRLSIGGNDMGFGDIIESRVRKFVGSRTHGYRKDEWDTRTWRPAWNARCAVAGGPACGSG